MPLISTFWLSNKKGSEVWLEAVVDRSARTWSFNVRTGAPKDKTVVTKGTKVGKGGFSCLLSDAPIIFDYARSEGDQGQIGSVMVAVVAEVPRGRLYLPSTTEQTERAKSAVPLAFPTLTFPMKRLGSAFRTTASGNIGRCSRHASSRQW